MFDAPKILGDLSAYVVVLVAYVCCHGITALLISPLQAVLLGEITNFASLIYLPHGVRVLAVWVLGWRALFPLVGGAFASELLFTHHTLFELLKPVLLESILIGALTALIPFSVYYLFDCDCFSGATKKMSWRLILGLGAVASVLNSLGQSYIFSGFIQADELLLMVSIYAVGDLLGLVLTMMGLMLIFRSIRSREQSA